MKTMYNWFGKDVKRMPRKTKKAMKKNGYWRKDIAWMKVWMDYGESVINIEREYHEKLANFLPNAFTKH
jgi:hypothetical protein